MSRFVAHRSEPPNANRCERFLSRSPQATRAYARRLAERARSGTVFALCGDLGSGKTCFAQGMALALGVEQPVTSPTFSLVREYAGTHGQFIHGDLYRLREAADDDTLDWDAYLEPKGLAAFEWADRSPDLFPPDTVWVRLETLDHPSVRRIRVGNKRVAF